MLLQITHCDVLVAVADICNLCNIMKYVDNSVFFKVGSENFHTLTRSLIGEWHWNNDNNKHNHHNSDSVNFSMKIKLKEVMEFAITPHVSYIQVITKQINLEFSFLVSQTVYFTGMTDFTHTSQMYHRISVLMPVFIRAPEHLSMSTSTSTGAITLELRSTSKVGIPEIQNSSTASRSTEHEYPNPG